MHGSSEPNFALGLLEVQGVGRVAANRILRHFKSVADLQQCPREQVLHRLSGLPNARETTERLLDPATMDGALARAKVTLDRCSQSRITCVPANSDEYPQQLRALDDRHLPVVCYLFGKLPTRSWRSVAFFGSAPIEAEPFERSQQLAERVVDAGAAVVLASESGFDVAMTRRVLGCGGSVVLVVHAGIDKLPRELRSVASAVVKSGGGIVSSFPLGHGPFEHDVIERSRLMAALARATVVCNESPSPATQNAARWGLDHQRAAFGLVETAGTSGLHIIQTEVDVEWLVSSISSPGEAS